MSQTTSHTAAPPTWSKGATRTAYAIVIGIVIGVFWPYTFGPYLNPIIERLFA